MAEIPLRMLNLSVASPVAEFPVRVPSSLRLPNIRSDIEVRIGPLLPIEQFLILVVVQARPPFPFVREYGKTHAKLAHLLNA